MIKNLKTLRLEKGISQQALANILGISQQSINKYENHDVEPDISILVAMADYFDTTIDYLVGRINNSNLLNDNFSAHEKKLVSQYHKLNDTEKLCVDTLIETYCTKK